MEREDFRTETENTYSEIVEIFQSKEIDFQPFPGSILYNRIREINKKDKKDIKEWEIRAMLRSLVFQKRIAVSMTNMIEVLNISKSRITDERVFHILRLLGGSALVSKIVEKYKQVYPGANEETLTRRIRDMYHPEEKLDRTGRGKYALKGFQPENPLGNFSDRTLEDKYDEY